MSMPHTCRCGICGHTMELLGTPMPLTHWSKDPLVPYADCNCSTCNAMRTSLTIETTDVSG